MSHEITIDDDVRNIIKWLEANVGKLLHTNENTEWIGEGWSIFINLRFRPGNLVSICFLVMFEDEELATLAKLKWGSVPLDETA